METFKDSIFKKKLLFLFVIFFSLFGLITWVSTFHNDFYPEIQTNFSEEYIRILYWTKGYSGTINTTVYSESLQNCIYKNCLFTNDKDKYYSSDAVVFYFWYLKEESLSNIMKIRPSGQKWIMHLLESPMRTYQIHKNKLAKFNNLFNVTWTYHTKSDITTNYSTGYFYLKSNDSSDYNITNNYAKGKTKLVAGFISNCKDASGRLKYINKLMQHVQVDIYGRCGILQCSDKELCYKMLEKDYKFYLAFENSLCDEYVTEKLWNVIAHFNVILVVMGGANYSQFLPPHSYIDIRDYKSPQKLAEYLHTIDTNDSLYNSYFKWKKSYGYMKLPYKSSWPCELCSYLNKSKNISRTVYSDLFGYWDKQKDCKKPEEMYPGIDKTVWL